MLLLYRNRVGWFQHKTTPTFGDPPGESVSWETRVFFGVEGGKRGVSPTWGSLPFLGDFLNETHGFMGVRVAVYEKQVFFWGSGHFSWEAFLSRSRWLDHVMSSTSKKGPKFWSDAELASKKAVKKWWGLIFLPPFYNILLGRIWSIKYLVLKIFRRNNETNLDQQSYNMQIYCFYCL